MFCENCGKQIPDNSKFCDGCGTLVKPAGAPDMQQDLPPYAEPDQNKTGPAGGMYNGPALDYGNPGYRGQGDYGSQGQADYINPGRQPQRDYRESERTVYVNPGSGYGRGYGGGPADGFAPEPIEEEKSGKTSTVLIVVLGVVAAALIGVLIFLAIRTFGGKSDDGNDGAIIEETESQEESSTPSESEPETTLPETTAAPTTAPTTAPVSPAQPTVPPTLAQMEPTSEYILPNSNSAYLSEADLVGLTKEELRIARNEIYARHGRKFKDAALNEYFTSKSWYVPLIEPDRFNENVFNDYETANRKLIADYEKKMGY